MSPQEKLRLEHRLYMRARREAFHRAGLTSDGVPPMRPEWCKSKAVIFRDRPEPEMSALEMAWRQFRASIRIPVFVTDL